MTTLPKSKPEKLRVGRRKRVALYARVSTQEQTKGQFPSCDSQIEELQAFAASRNWEIIEEIKDEGHRAGTLQRPGLTFLRHLVSSQQVDIVACTWYNRLIGSRDFYVLDKEFKANDVDFVTLHDPADRNTASGRLLESMLVTIKTFENEQIAEKVQTKMRQRAEKGLWNGGLTPFGFVRDFANKSITPCPEKIPIVEQMFRCYVDTQSDFAVRDWLKTHQIPTRSGKNVWSISTLRDILTNRLYIGEIEINRHNKGRDDCSDFESYRIAKATFTPPISAELFELAQAIRREKATLSPNRVGKPHKYGGNQVGRIYLLQGTLLCGVCGHAMTPHYTFHKAGKNRRKDSYFHYYVCAPQVKASQNSPHKNCISAGLAEESIMEAVRELIEPQGLLESCLESAWEGFQNQVRPELDSLNINKGALAKNQEQIDNLVNTIANGNADGALFEMLNRKASELRIEREKLLVEQRQLQKALAPLAKRIECRDFPQLINFLG